MSTRRRCAGSDRQRQSPWCSLVAERSGDARAETRMRRQARAKRFTARIARAATEAERRARLPARRWSR